MSDQPQRFFEFDNFLVDSQQRMVLRDGVPLDLTPKVFDILLELIESSGRVLEKKELMEHVWPDSFVEESNLTQHISTLRKKLGQEQSQQRYILTVPGRGYRFVMPVKSWDDDAVVTVQERVRSRITVRDEGDAPEPARELVQSSVRLLPPETARPVPRALIVGGLALLLVAGIVVAIFWPRRIASAPFSQVRLSRFTTDGRVACAAISPNGKEVAYAEANGAQQTLLIRQVVTSNAGVVVVPPLNIRYVGLTFSPDSNYIFYIAGLPNSPTTLYRVPALGGKPVALAEDVDSPPAFSPDGKQMVYVRGYPDAKESVLMNAGVDGSSETRLATLKFPRLGFTFGPAPSWSPDGKLVGCSISIADESGQYQEIYMVNAQTGELQPLTHRKWLRVYRMAWVKDGSGLMTTAADSETGVLQVWFVSYPSGEPRKITNDLNDYQGLTLTSDSKIAAVVESDQQSNIWVAPAVESGSAVQTTWNNYEGVDGLAWMPDGRLVYTAIKNNTQDLFVADLQGKQNVPLTENQANNYGVAVSPDGRTIVFTSTRDGKQHLWRMDADGNRVQRITDGVRDTNPVFTPDGKWIVYQSAVSGNPNIFKIPVEGGAPVRLTQVISGPPTVSPDGKTVACTQRLAALAKLKIALIPIDGLAPATLFEPKDVPRRLMIEWSKDGKSLVYIKTSGDVSNLWSMALDGGEPRQLTNFASDLIYNFAVSADGRLAVTRGRENTNVVLLDSVN